MLKGNYSKTKLGKICLEDKTLSDPPTHPSVVSFLPEEKILPQKSVSAAFTSGLKSEFCNSPTVR